MMYIGAYTNSIILAGRTEEQLQKIINNLSNKFKMKYFGKLKYFPGMKVVYDKEK